MDAAFTIAHKGIQHNVRASRILNLERLDTVVGPIQVKVIEPLQKLQVLVNDKDQGLMLISLLMVSQKFYKNLKCICMMVLEKLWIHVGWFNMVHGLAK